MSTKTILALAGVASISVAALVYVLRKNNKAASKAAAKPEIDEQKLVSIMTAITLNMKNVYQQAMAGVESKLRQMNPHITEEQLRQELAKFFEMQLQHIETEVYKQLNVTEEQVRIAAEYYSDNKEFQKQASSLRYLYSVLTGGEPDFEPLSLEQTMGLFVDIYEAMDRLLITMLAELDAKDLGPEEFQLAFQQMRQEETVRLMAAVCEKNGVSTEQFEHAVQKYQRAQEMMMLQQQLQMKSQQREVGLAQKIKELVEKKKAKTDAEKEKMDDLE